MEPIRVLYVNGGIMQRAGTESYMMNYYRNIDRTKIQIDFIVHGNEKGVYDDEIKELGGEIYNVPVKSKDYIGNIKAIESILKTGKYKIIHSHMDAMSMVVLKIAKKCGIPIRIAHSHNTQHHTKNKIKFILNEYARKNICKYATHLFACSEDAARWLFGDEAINEGNVKIINNAINIEKFKFNKKKRDILRENMCITDNFVIGHIGRFDYQKNHIFLLDIFKETLNYIPNAKLVLVGDGHLRKEIEKKIKDIGIEDDVILTGNVENVYELINTFDLFILPSLFEGLGIVLIEAQANGLPCIASNNVPKDVNLSNLVSFVDLNDTLRTWVDKIIELKKENLNRENAYTVLESCGYNISIEAKRLEKIYLSLYEEYLYDNNIFN